MIMQKLSKSVLISILATTCITAASSANAFDNIVFFGDSNTDNGRFAGVPQYTTGPMLEFLMPQVFILLQMG